MSHGHIEFYESINSTQKCYTIRFNPSTVHENYSNMLVLSVKEYPGIKKAQVYRNLNSVVWLECDIPAIAAAEAGKSAVAGTGKIAHLNEARRAKETEKAATIVEAHRVFYNFEKQKLEHQVQELTITPVLRFPAPSGENGIPLARQDLLGAVNLNKNGYALVWLCRPVTNEEQALPLVMVNELFTKDGRPYFTLPEKYLPAQEIRFYSLFDGKTLSGEARVLPDNGKEVLEIQYAINIGQDCPDPKEL